MNINEIVDYLLNIKFEGLIDAPYIEIGKNNNNQYTAELSNVWVLSDDEESMAGEYGVGSTVEEALSNYIAIIKGKTLIIQDELEEEKEYTAFVS